MVTLNKSRIEALSDGVFAIAMTLLVLKLDIPAVMVHHTNEMMLHQLLDMRVAFAIYVITFLIAGGFWFLHHLTFHFIRHVDGFLVWINLILLMLISLLPFSAGLTTHLFIHPVTQFFYFGNQLAIAVLLNIHWYYAKRRSFTADGDAEDVWRISFRLGLAAAMFTACLITAAFLPSYSLLPLPLFLLIGAGVEGLRTF